MNMTTGQYEWAGGKLDLLYKADNIVVWYHPEHKIMYADWIGYQKEAALKEAGEMILKILSDKQCTKILNDNTRVVGHWYHSVDWTSADWFPRMLNAGLKHFAWICSDDVFTQLSAKRAIPEGDVVRPFQTCQEAFDWLTGQP